MYTKTLNQVGHRVFWSAVAIKSFIVRGSDASKAFAEAPPLKHPLYVKIDLTLQRMVEAEKEPTRYTKGICI